MTGGEFRSLRLQAKLTQEGIARLLEVSVGTIRLWEGHSKRDVHVINKTYEVGVRFIVSKHMETGQVQFSKLNKTGKLRGER